MMGDCGTLGNTGLRATFPGRSRTVITIGTPRAKAATVTHAPRFLN